MPSIIPYTKTESAYAQKSINQKITVYLPHVFSNLRNHIPRAIDSTRDIQRAFCRGSTYRPEVSTDKKPLLGGPCHILAVSCSNPESIFMLQADSSNNTVDFYGFVSKVKLHLCVGPSHPQSLSSSGASDFDALAGSFEFLLNLPCFSHNLCFVDHRRSPYP